MDMKHHTDGWMGRQINREQMDEWTDRKRERQTVQQTDGQSDSLCVNLKVTRGLPLLVTRSDC